jgi:hypothetical protein
MNPDSISSASPIANLGTANPTSASDQELAAQFDQIIAGVGTAAITVILDEAMRMSTEDLTS